MKRMRHCMWNLNQNQAQNQDNDQDQNESSPSKPAADANTPSGEFCHLG